MAAGGLGVGSDLDQLPRLDVRSTLATLDLPIYGLWGADDPVVPINIAVRRLTDAAPRPVTVRIMPSAEHPLPTGIGWVADWIAAQPDLDADDLTGVEPASAAGVGSLPASRWYLNPLLHTIVSAGMAILVIVLTSRIAAGDHSGVVRVITIELTGGSRCNVLSVRAYGG